MGISISKFFRKRNRKVIDADQQFASIEAQSGVQNAPSPCIEQTLRIVHPYDYDLIVVGGGSGGLSCANEAAMAGAKVALFDYVKPTPIGTSWGLGGTCDNVGGIPKKMMHAAASFSESIEDAKSYGWQIDSDKKKKLSWEKMSTAIQSHIGSINWNHRISLRDNKVEYINSYAKFRDSHTIEGTGRRGKSKLVTGNNIVLALGLRPKYPGIPGDREFGITSDDICSLEYSPGKTLVVGASYVALAIGGALHELGFEVSIMVKSVLLRNLDQEIAERVAQHMQSLGIRFIRPASVVKLEQLKPGKPGLLRVTCEYTDGTGKGDQFSEEYNTVVWAIGREPSHSDMNLEAAGLKLNSRSKKFDCNKFDQTNVHHIYAIGDIQEGMLQQHSVAAKAGCLLARRLFLNESELMDYDNVPTTVFTPLEYARCGLTEEAAIRRHGLDKIEVYHTLFNPLEWCPSARSSSDHCYMKLICDKTQNGKVIGIHYLGPNAGEIIQGYAVAMKSGATKRLFDQTLGVHPTTSEILTGLTVTKSSGKPLTMPSS